MIPYSPSRLDSTQFITERLKVLTRGRKSYLDVGCGRLFFYNLLRILNTRGNYIGIDLKPLKISKSQSNMVTHVEKKDFLKYKNSRKFDIVACFWVLEHIKDDEKTVLKISSHLKNNGYLILSVPSIWSWPFEFGRHGFHYYTKKKILNYVRESKFNIKEVYEAGGFVGFVFMIFYNWPRYLILILSLPFFITLKLLNIYNKPWKIFSKNLILSTLYFYHRWKIGIYLHNAIVKTIVKLDNILKLFPASYIIIAQK
ncbi:MAG: Methyltransferase [Parcubacteria group bacterium GW2011_GWA1_36_12]|nr:MAG: Methyltransferase [Parcubacteria group bacterium GW2011_GWA1_36_12]